MPQITINHKSWCFLQPTYLLVNLQVQIFLRTFFYYAQYFLLEAFCSKSALSGSKATVTPLEPLLGSGCGPTQSKTSLVKNTFQTIWTPFMKKKWLHRCIQEVVELLRSRSSRTTQRVYSRSSRTTQRLYSRSSSEQGSQIQNIRSIG